MDYSNITPDNSRTRHLIPGGGAKNTRQSCELPRDLHLPELTEVVEQTISSLAIFRSKLSTEPNCLKILSLAQVTDTVLAGNANCSQQDLIALLSARIKAGSVAVPTTLRAAYNYGIALTYGLDLVRDRPAEAFGSDAIRQIHRVLSDSIAIRGVPGQFREHISNLTKSSFVDADLIENKLREFEDFVLFNPPQLPFVQRLAMAYAHLEITAPFFYGNRYIARIVFQMMLEQAGYPSVPIAMAFSERYGSLDEELMELKRTGHWLNWLEFFLKGFWEALSRLHELCDCIQILQTEWAGKLRMRRDAAGRRIADSLLVSPVTTVSDVQTHFQMSFQTANKAISDLIKVGIIKVVSGSKPIRRNRYFVATDVIRCTWDVSLGVASSSKAIGFHALPKLRDSNNINIFKS